MKSEERHRLHQNELERIVEKAAPPVVTFYQQNQAAILGGGALLVVLIGVVLWMNSGESADADGWNAMFRAQTEGGETAIANFENIAETYADSGAGIWSELSAGNRLMDSGIGLMFSNRSGGKSDLERAKEYFQKVLDNSAASVQARERAAFGIATCEEALSGEDTSGAIATYEKFTSDYSNSVFVQVANDRMKRLKEANGRSFYAWFSAQNPKPDDRPTPSDLGGTDPFLDTLPEIPDMLKLPEEDVTKESPKGTAPLLPDGLDEKEEAAKDGESTSPPEEGDSSPAETDDSSSKTEPGPDGKDPSSDDKNAP